MPNTNQIDLITINLFTNSTLNNSPYTGMIRETLESFYKYLKIDKKVKLNIFIDPNPNVQCFEKYKHNIEDYLKNNNYNYEIFITTSLVNGYIMSIENSTTPVLLQIEHDWILNSSLIEHRCNDFIKLIMEHNIEHLRFNKRINQEQMWDHKLRQITLNNIQLCKTTCRSNNPHFLLREKYLDLIKFMNPNAKGSEGIEIEITNRTDGGYIYGGLNLKNTIVHIDGRHRFYSKTYFKIINKYSRQLLNPHQIEITHPQLLTDAISKNKKILKVNWETNLCNCIHNTYDVIIIKDYFEHVLEPEVDKIKSLLNENGVFIITCNFISRYNPKTYDLIRYTHTGIRYLMEKNNGIANLICGYISPSPQKGDLKNNTDCHLRHNKPFDHVDIYYIGMKKSDKIFFKEDLDSNNDYTKK